MQELREKYKDYIKLTIINRHKNTEETIILNLNDKKDIEIGKKIRDQKEFKARTLTTEEMLDLEDWENFKKEL